MMESVNRRATLLLLLLVLLAAPVANAWCSTVCIAAAISTGCAHGLQVTDDLPLAKSMPAVSVQHTWTPVADSPVHRPPIATTTTVSHRTPLRL
jgi:hypothetical protein